MTEILTESFCERCGSRYTFESSAPRKSGLGRVKVFSKGVRNFVMSDGSTFSEAMADARSEEALAATAHQIDAFHRTFNFCLDCRQYTCGPCWNPGEGRCLTCAPDPALEAAAVAASPPVAEVQAAIPGNAVVAETWPDTDVPAERLARAVGASPPAGRETDLDVEATVTVDGRLAAEDHVLPAEAAIEAEAEAHATATEAEADVSAAAEAEADLPGPPVPASLRGLVPGESLEAAIAAWEARQPYESATAEAQPEPEPEPVAASAVEAVPFAGDVIPQPAWPVAAVPAQAEPIQPATPVQTPPETPAPWLTVAPDEATSEPRWPTVPGWPRTGASRQAPTTLAGRPLLPQGDAAALWAASAREVLSAAPAALRATAAPPTPQPCVECGLPLSANARFCRRCGTRQV